MAVHTERSFIEFPDEILISSRWQNDANSFDANDSTFSNCNLTASETGQQQFAGEDGGHQRAFIGVEMDWEIEATNFRVRLYNQSDGTNDLIAEFAFVGRSRRTESFFFTPSKRGSEARRAKFTVEVLRIFGSSNSGVHLHEVRFITAPRGEMAPVEGGA